MCGYDNIEQEKRRRRQLRLEKDRKQMEEQKNSPQHNHNHQIPYNPSGPPQPYYSGQSPQHSPQFYQQPPQMSSHPSNQPHNPYSPAGYPQLNEEYDPAPAQKINGPPLAQAQPQENKGFFAKAKEKVNKILK